MGFKTKITAEDRRWAKAVKERDGYQCQRCGRAYPGGGNGIEAAHIVSRRFKATRTLLANGITLCTGCHSWAHRNPTEWAIWIVSVIGQEALDALEKAKRTTKRAGRTAA